MTSARWLPSVPDVSIGDMTPLFLLPLALFLNAHGAHEPSPEHYARVRPEDDTARVIIWDGVQSSPTVAGLVDSLERSNVIVYIRTVPGLHRRGMLTLMAHTDLVTYLLVRLDPALTRRDRIAALAHELTHALEVASSTPPIRNEADLEKLYRRIGVPGTSAHDFESREARAVETRVRTELARVLSPPPADPPHRRQQR